MELSNVLIAIFGSPDTVRWGLILLFITIAVGCLVGAVYGSRLRRRDTQLGLRAVLLTNGLWLGFQALGLVTTDEALSSAIYVAGLICGLTGVAAWMYFISAYTGRSYHRNRRYRGLAASVYVGLVIIKLTNPIYGLYVSTELRQTPYTHLVVEPQLFYWVSFSLTYTLVAISFYWVIKTLRQSPFPSGSIGALAVLALFPIVPRAAISILPSEVLPPIMLGLSFEPIGVTAFLIGVLVFVGKPFRQLEHSARSKVFEEANDAVFVYDTDDQLVELNNEAEKLSSAIDLDLTTVEAFGQAFRPVNKPDNTAVVSLEIDGSTRQFDVTADRMATGAEAVGTVATVRDVTGHRAHGQWLQEFLNRGPLMLVRTRQVEGEAIIDSANGRFLQRLGYDRNEVEGEPLASFYTTGSAADMQQGGYEDALAGTFGINERTLVDVDEQPVYTLLRAVPRERETDGTTALFVDVTELKTREKELESFQQAVEEAADGVAILDDDEYVYADRTHVDMYGLDSQEQLLGETWRKLYDDDEVARLEAEAFPTLQDDGYWRGMVTGSRPDGSTFPAELSLTIVGDGRLVCTVRDETERLERERELKLKEQAMDNATVGIQITDATREENPLVYVNDGFEQMTGYTSEAALGRNSRFLRGSDTDAEQTRQLQEAIAAEEPASVELKYYRNDGTPYWARVSLTPVTDEYGTVTNYIAIQQDVTEQKRRKQEAEARVDLLERTYEVTTDPQTGFEEKITGLLEVGGDHLDLPYGFLTQIDVGDDETAGTQTILEAVGSHELLQPGESGPLSESYCQRTVDHNGTLAVTNAAESELVDDTAYDSFGLETYIGGNVAVGDDTYGTLCFASSEQRESPLDEFDRSFVSLLGQWVGYEIERKESRERLYEERERFRMLTESVEEYAFLVVNEAGTIQTWNAGAENLLLYDDESALGMPMAELYPESDRESGLPERLIQQARLAGESAHEGWQVRADGSTFYADVRYAPLESDDGEFRGYAMIVRDTTEQRRQRRRTERFVEESEDVVTIVDPDGTVTYASGSAERVFDYDPDAIVGENLFDYLHPDGREHAMETFFSCVEESKSVTAECRLKSPDGGWFNIEGRCRNMLDDDAIEGILVYLRDVTEKKERARRFESIFNQTFQFTGLLEPDGTVIEINDAALDFGGFDRDEVIGSPFFEARWWTHSEAVYDEVRSAIERAADGEFVRYETEVRGGDGLATIDFSVKPVTDDDGDVSLLVVEGRDITGQQQRSRHLRVMQRVMRHNMRNDLGKVRGWTELMSEEADATERAEQFRRVESILDKWDSMTEKMKEITQVLNPEDGELAMTAAGPLVEDVAGQIREEHTDTTVLTDGTDGESVQVPTTFRKAVYELVENAAKVKETATIEVTVRSDDEWVEISVTDDGPGMPEMEADVLETGEEDPLNHGKGLGLWMVRMIATQAGGNVLAESTADGTEVRLRVPSEQR